MSSMIYPALLTAVGTGSILILLNFVIPRFAAVFTQSHIPMPLPTQILMRVSDIVRTFGLPAIAGLVLLLLSARAYIRTPGGRLAWDRLRLRIPLLGDGTNHYQLLEVTDLVDAIVRAATVETCVNETMNIAADRYQTLNEDMQALFDHAGSGSKLWHLPARPGEFALRGLELVRLSPLAAWHYGTMWRDSYVEVDKAKRLLDWQPRYSNAEALIRIFDGER